VDAIEQYRIVSAFSASATTCALLSYPAPFQEHALSEDDIHKLIFTKQKGSTFWQDVGEWIPWHGLQKAFNEHRSW
jgi:hypothetical protein